MGSAFDEDPFKNKDPFGGGSNGGDTHADPFAADDPFKSSDPFKSEGFTSDPFASDDPFKDAFPASSDTTSNSKDDPFSSSDPFGSSFSSSSGGTKQMDAFDSFGTASSKPQRPSCDLFGSDPFAPSPPAKSGSESPRPALPPKRKTAPPPRPAPPKGKSPMSSPSKPKKPDPFGAGAFPNDPFGTSDPFRSSNVVSGTLGGGDAISTNFADFSPSKTSGWAFCDDELGWAFHHQQQQQHQDHHQQHCHLQLQHRRVKNQVANHQNQNHPKIKN